ncbi:hypothetical protein [Paraburkholderia aspalathi]|uniref:hypothetical protein n=1 Tax=Paraburkholderia aspalathi TaxID=1324617 RepID=UPI0035570FDF
MHTVELDGAQRDLCETARTAIQEMVRVGTTEKGFARSHIVVLDALLKLRQVCCAPPTRQDQPARPSQGIGQTGATARYV